ncbi:hypothetical protein PIB30_053866 [Stylosanthes scabra]|uniref:Uncharacterized protein n=1 Tax=Stylosanthes scabra TaxID=79078 RepID=A0ABU6QJ08_9FABA|nr:hypothetical protein [Stylosanthes scabra]
MRQFGADQLIPVDPVNVDAFLTTTGRGEDVWWSTHRTTTAWYESWSRVLALPTDIPPTPSHPRQKIPLPLMSLCIRTKGAYACRSLRATDGRNGVNFDAVNATPLPAEIRIGVNSATLWWLVSFSPNKAALIKSLAPLPGKQKCVSVFG